MNKRKPMLSGSLVLVALLVLSGIAGAGHSYSGWSFGGGKVMNSGLARVVMGGGAAAASSGNPITEIARAPKPSYTCVEPCTSFTLFDSNGNVVSPPTLTGSGDILGLGKASGGQWTIQALGIGVYECVNQGGNTAPGQNRPLVFADGQGLFGGDEVTKNGKYRANVLAPYGGTIFESASVAGCPNETWTSRLVAIEWVQAKVKVEQTDLKKCNVFTFRNGGTLECLADEGSH